MSDDKDQFPKKYSKLLPDGFESDAQAMSDEDLKKEMNAMEFAMHNLDKEKAADEKLNAAKELMKDLGGGYREARAPMNAKLKYCIYVLDSRGKV